MFSIESPFWYVLRILIHRIVQVECSVFLFELQPPFFCLSKFYYRNYYPFYLLVLFFIKYLSIKPGSIAPSDMTVTPGTLSETKSMFRPYKPQPFGKRENESLLLWIIKIDNNNLTCSDRNRNRGGVTCFIRNYLSYNLELLLPSQIQNLFCFHRLNL